MFGSLSPTIEPFGDQPRGDDFAPSDIAGLTVDIDPGIFASIAFNGSDIAGIENQALAKHLEQSTASAQPLYVASVAEVGGKACIRCDGVDEYLYGVGSWPISDVLTNALHTTYVVCVPRAITTNAANFYDNDTPISDSLGYYAGSLRSAPTASFGNFDTTSDEPTPQSITLGQGLIIMASHGGNSLACSINGGAEQTAASGNTGSVGGYLQLGQAAMAAGIFTEVDIARVLIWNVLHSAGEKAQVIDYLQREYGL